MTPSVKSIEIAKAILADEFTSKKLYYRIALALDAARVPKVDKSDEERAMEVLKEMTDKCHTVPYPRSETDLFTVQVNVLAQSFAEIRAESQPELLSESELHKAAIECDPFANVSSYDAFKAGYRLVVGKIK